MFLDWQDSLILFSFRALELICLCYFLTPLEKRKNGNWIAAVQVFGFTVLLTLVRELIYLVDWESEFIYINFAYYPIIFTFILIRYELSIKEVIYFLLLFFLCVHPLRPLAMRISDILFGENYLVVSSHPIYNMMALAAFSIVLFSEFTLLKKHAFRFLKHRLTWSQLLLIIIATIPVVYVTNLFLFMNLDKSNVPISALIIGMVCSICGMTIVIGYNNTLALGKYQQEMFMLESMLVTQQKQYQLKKETTEIIHAKYHDLKKHIAYLASIESQKEREEYLGSFKLQLSVYDAFHDTGNDTLNIVLTDKDMECRRNGIRLLLFVDGKQIDFLQPLDIVSIFGNALDNSIEAVSKLPEEGRDITVRMREYDSWLALSFENNFSGELKWKDRRLASTKSKVDDHGYGLVSIETAVEKYGGHMAVDVEGTQFILKVLFPKQKGQT